MKEPQIPEIDFVKETFRKRGILIGEEARQAIARKEDAKRRELEAQSRQDTLPMYVSTEVQ